MTRVVRIWYFFLFITIEAVFIGCASKSLDYEKLKPIESNEEFEKMVKVKELPASQQPKVEVKPKPPTVEPKSQAKSKPEKPAKDKVTNSQTKIARKEPSLEDAEGFIGRRPVIDPYVVGERVTLAVTYLNVEAGDLILETLPFVEVNGRKSYHFKVSIRTNKLFSYVYEVDDWAETFVDFELLSPYTLGINVKESKQFKEIKSYFDWKKKIGQYWETRITPENGKVSKKKVWSILPYAQNVISAPFYLRAFHLVPEKDLAFRVADAGENLVFKGEVLRREPLKTTIGTLKTVVVRPTITMNGAFKQVGDILIWLTDDERKQIVRIEAKINIGSLICKLKSIEYL